MILQSMISKSSKFTIESCPVKRGLNAFAPPKKKKKKESIDAVSYCKKRTVGFKGRIDESDTYSSHSQTSHCFYVSAVLFEASPVYFQHVNERAAPCFPSVSTWAVVNLLFHLLSDGFRLLGFYE